MNYEQDNAALDVQDELLKDPDYLKTKNRIQVLLMRRYLVQPENAGKSELEVKLEWTDKYSENLRKTFNNRFSKDKASVMKALSSLGSTNSLLADLEVQINQVETCAV